MYLTSYYTYWVGNKVINDLRHDLFNKVIYFPISFFQSSSTGELMSHFLNDILMIQNVSSMVVREGVRSVFEAIFLLSFAFYQNWRLTLLMLIVGPLITTAIRKIGRARKNASIAIQLEMGKISNMLQESFVGIREIKAFNGEPVEQKRFNNRIEQCFLSIMRSVHIEALAPALIEAFAMTGCCLVFYVAVRQVIAGVISAGALTSFVAAVILAYQPIKKLVTLYSEIQYGLAAADRIFLLMDRTFPALSNRYISLKNFSNKIELLDVSFSYSQDIAVFSNVTFSISRGESIGIIGPSGAGKSTLCDLLLGFIVPTSGKILIDGKDITKISFIDLRALIGYVGQKMFLFNDTVYNNVIYGSSNINYEKVIKSCCAAHADEFIQKLSNKYEEIVGENGALLSGGQKQRMTIARALLKDPEILIFDEATSALDQESEQMIRLAIQEIKGDKTLIIVSHRQSMLELVDRVFSVQNKSIQEISSVKEFPTDILSLG
jgi:subfamily B ATP-binding cassette protein MsbA